jgi:predicted GNAT family N-acyltransferase
MLVHRLDRNLHNRTTFDCGDEALNNYLKTLSGQHNKKHLSRTFVLTECSCESSILGYFSLALTQVSLDQLPEQLHKKYPQGVKAALLGRLAINKSDQGKGLGAVLLIDAVLKAYNASLIVPTPMLVVDAKDQKAKSFYLHYGFESLPESDLKLMLTMKQAELLLRSAELI